jgi:hypothetical protein
MRRRESNGPHEDDWLAEEDWLEAPTQETPPAPSRRRRPQPPAGAPSRRLLALVAGVSILVLVILVAVLQGGGDEAAEPTPTAPPTETSAEPQAETEGNLRLAAGATLAEGDSGARVRRLQRALASLGYEVTPDGEFGPGTTAAVRAFQEDAGLDADGVAGSATVSALNEALAADG